MHYLVHPRASSHAFALCSPPADPANDVICIDPADPLKDRGFTCLFYPKKTKMMDGVHYLTTRLELSFDDVDFRDFDDFYNKHKALIVCRGQGVLARIPKSRRHMLVDCINYIKEDARNKPDNSYRGNAYSTMASSTLTAAKPRQVLFVLPDDMRCSNNVTSPEPPTNDQEAQIYIPKVDGKFKRAEDKNDPTEYGLATNVGQLVLHVVSEKPEPLETGDAKVHSLADAVQGMDI